MKALKMMSAFFLIWLRPLLTFALAVACMYQAYQLYHAHLAVALAHRQVADAHRQLEQADRAINEARELLHTFCPAAGPKL